MAKARPVSEPRRRLIEITQRRIEVMGWSLNERTMNASYFCGAFSVMIYFEETRRHEVGLVNPLSRNTSRTQMEWVRIAHSVAHAEKTIDEVRKCVSDLYRWMKLDMLECMAILAKDDSEWIAESALRAKQLGIDF